MRDVTMAVAVALSLDLGRVCGQDRADECSLEEFRKLGALHARLLEAADDVTDRALRVILAGETRRVPRTILVSVLRDVRKLREVSERADDRDRGFDVELVSLSRRAR
jgi:hypothetical protein